MLDFSVICPSCMQDKGKHILCSHCGYNEREYKEDALYIKPRTLFKEQYLLGNVIGQGGFGITYIGLDVKLLKKIAIKEYLPVNLAARAGRDTRDFTRYTVVPWKNNQTQIFQEGLHSFLEEARKIAEFSHDNIVRIINYFEENGTAYLVMEYLEGEDLTNFLKKQPNSCLSVREALAILYPILDALKEIHAKHLYHRDISAPNIRIIKGNKPVLIDFGASKYIVGEASHTLERIYKPGYSPWEQMVGSKEVGAWTDIYSCGATFYFMLTGKLPPIATERFEHDGLIAPSNVKALGIPSQFDNTILRALAVRIKDRFQTVDEFKAALVKDEQQWLNPSDSFSLPKTPPISTSHYLKYIYYILYLLLVCILAIYIGINYFFEPETVLIPREHIPSEQDINSTTVAPCHVIDPYVNETYEGECKNGVAHGKGKATGRDTYEGEFKEGQFNGEGTYIWQAGDRYVGQFKNGYLHGNGTIFYANGDVIEGIWEDGQKVDNKVESEESKEPTEPEAKVDNLNEKITTLLTECKQHFDAKRFTTGTEGTALECYQEVLQLDSNNQEALKGIENIESQYIELIKNTLNKKQFSFKKATNYLVSLEKTNPHSSELLNLYYEVSEAAFKIGENDNAKEAFTKKVAIEIENYHQLSIKFLFMENSDQFYNDTALRKRYSTFWLQAIAEYFEKTEHCFNIVGYPDNSKNKDADLALQRAKKIQTELQKYFPDITKKTKLITGKFQTEKINTVEFELSECE